MTFAEVIRDAIRHPSPRVGVNRKDRHGFIQVVGAQISGRILDITDLDADDWEIFDIYLAES